MSGGSYNYLCHKWAEELVGGYGEEFDWMIERLRVLGFEEAVLYHEQFRDEIFRVRAEMEKLERQLLKIQPVWKAVEWYDSGDWGLDQVEEAVREFRNV